MLKNSIDIDAGKNLLIILIIIFSLKKIEIKGTHKTA